MHNLFFQNICQYLKQFNILFYFRIEKLVVMSLLTRKKNLQIRLDVQKQIDVIEVPIEVEKKNI